MQTHTPDLVELTLMWDLADNRHAYWVKCKSGEISNAIFATSLALPMLIVFDIPPISKAIFVSLLAYLGISRTFARWRSLRNVPDWVFAPNTYRIDEIGVQYAGPDKLMQVPWAAVTGLQKTKRMWIFVGVNGSIWIPRRTLTEADEAALERVSERYSSQRGTLVAGGSTTVRG